MDDDIYENVNGTESEGMNRERGVKMDDMYVNAGSVGNHDYRTNSNTQQPPQNTAGWTYFQSSFYYLSNESKSWTDSRGDCKGRKADLITINNRQEQDFVMTLTRNKEFWIGLTDSEKEGQWKWVDGSTLTTGFWASFRSITEPNGGTRENCVLTHLKRHPELIGWIDHNCDASYQWICEKSILPVTF
ncbi:C-type lectin domain family 4 member M isoform X2 [Danio rerio]|uniref:C-type lectin domain family 4 member M isoform X2 n=4 Tax=Danio rerio TaxID=7955 RepID=A0AC58GM05_DANRE